MSTIATSRFLSLVLRHRPELIGVTLDRAGWIAVDTLLAACAAHGKPLTRDQLARMVAESDKQRFALSPDGSQIRANQGHSVAVDLALAPVAPPATLFHGTHTGVIADIEKAGLVKGDRHHVHLSADLATATKVGARRGTPVILTVRAAAMAADGHVFFRSANGVWLVDAVPVGYLEVP